jgi:hypothetical protein
MREANLARADVKRTKHRKFADVLGSSVREAIASMHVERNKIRKSFNQDFQFAVAEFARARQAQFRDRSLCQLRKQRRIEPHEIAHVEVRDVWSSASMRQRNKAERGKKNSRYDKLQNIACEAWRHVREIQQVLHVGQCTAQQCVCVRAPAQG